MKPHFVITLEIISPDPERLVLVRRAYDVATLSSMSVPNDETIVSEFRSMVEQLCAAAAAGRKAT